MSVFTFTQPESRFLVVRIALLRLRVYTEEAIAGLGFLGLFGERIDEVTINF